MSALNPETTYFFRDLVRYIYNNSTDEYSILNYFSKVLSLIGIESDYTPLKFDYINIATIDDKAEVIAYIFDLISYRVIKPNFGIAYMPKLYSDKLSFVRAIIGI